ncbi:MAG TPA: hypothetical protein PK404_04655 [Fervidobacterium sp.]|mgnify:FL=1|nr:hypothetical protein [Fervidobacterium sp.]HOK88105.1 hypothetical protein [Fervidobacterium sp.]HOM74514.1 hypothetical protein [Fervidobacterium sp.]HPP18106.1 hypothetical protein [Fervidobacterium sp.]HRD20884.1 hypothetical protein [Fervidobacterium sp.]
MKAKHSYVGKKQKKERNLGKPIVISILILLAVVGMFVGSKVFIVRNSEEFSLDKISFYYFYVEKSNLQDNDAFLSKNNKIIIVNGRNRTVELIDIPNTTYIYSKNLEVGTSNPRDFSILFAELIGLKPDFVYFLPQREEFFKKTGVNSMDDFIVNYGRRGLKFTDYFVLGSQVSSMRPESNITESSLAKLYYGLGTYSLRGHDIPMLTKAPLKITVGNRVYLRSYIDEDRLEDIVKELEK